MGICFDHADSFEIDHFDQYFHLVFWLKANNDTVFEAIALEYDRYEPPVGARSCHKYLILWQDLKISISYVNHVLLAILRHMGTFKNVFNILIVQISGLGRTLHLACQILEWSNGRVWFLKQRVSLDILPKNETQTDMCVKGAISTQNRKLLISLSLFCNYEM